MPALFQPHERVAPVVSDVQAFRLAAPVPVDSSTRRNCVPARRTEVATPLA